MDPRTTLNCTVRSLSALVLTACLFASSGCQWMQTRYEALRGEGFKGAHQDGMSLRGDVRDAKPSGFFTDKRSDQIEQNLGGF